MKVSSSVELNISPKKIALLPQTTTWCVSKGICNRFYKRQPTAPLTTRQVPPVIGYGGLSKSEENLDSLFIAKTIQQSHIKRIRQPFAAPGVEEGLRLEAALHQQQHRHLPKNKCVLVLGKLDIAERILQTRGLPS